MAHPQSPFLSTDPTAGTAAPAKSRERGRARGVVVTKPGTTQRFRFPTQRHASAALAEWRAQPKKR